MHTREEKLAAFGRLLDIMDALREKCPWNAAQTMDSIRPMTEEEVYELSDTILEGDRQGTAKEIGDLLYHMVFYARIGEEEGAFDIADSIGKVCDKMVFRHPHIRSRGRQAHVGQGNCRHLGTGEGQGKGRQQNRHGRHPQGHARHFEGPFHAGKGPRRRF